MKKIIFTCIVSIFILFACDRTNNSTNSVEPSKIENSLSTTSNETSITSSSNSSSPQVEFSSSSSSSSTSDPSNPNSSSSINSSSSSSNTSSYSTSSSSSSTSSQVLEYTEIFISEYFEGGYDKDYNPTGKNDDKAIELYNPTDEDIDLNGYSIKVFRSNETNVVNLTGTIKSGECALFINLYAQESLKSLTCPSNLGQLYFSGKQAVGLYKGEVLIDLIGIIGVYENMMINGVEDALADNRMIRVVNKPNEVFTESEWIVCNDMTFDNLGIFDMID